MLAKLVIFPRWGVEASMIVVYLGVRGRLAARVGHPEPAA